MDASNLRRDIPSPFILQRPNGIHMSEIRKYFKHRDADDQGYNESPCSFANLALDGSMQDLI